MKKSEKWKIFMVIIFLIVGFGISFFVWQKQKGNKSSIGNTFQKKRCDFVLIFALQKLWQQELLKT